MLPDFLIIGAMKAGTSSLYRYIASHPRVAGSSVKETDFFARKELFDRGRERYAAFFRGGGEHAFEASPNYTKRHLFPGVPERMHSLIPAARLIYLVRDPIERVVSHYIHNYANGRESRSFSDAIREDDNYIKTSQYYLQLQAFLEYYPGEQILIVESEMLREDPKAVLEQVYRFVGLPADHESPLVNRRFHESRSKARRSALEQRIANGIDNRYLQSGVRALFRPLRTPVSRPDPSADDREVLADRIGPDAASFRRFSDLALARWSV